MLFKRIQRFKRILSAFLILSLINQIVAPSVALALTSGPVSPEASSFEPVDTTDMVNTLTGDFIYNLPLIEVPGSEGNYPLSLSYHAGIQPQEEASWVGLGWTLNPGAINRSVSGYPDDWFATGASRRDYWEGGVTNTTNIGFNIPISGVVGASFGLSFANDTYKGFGMGGYLGATYFFPGTPFSASIGVGISPYGESAGLYGGVGIGKQGIGGASMNFSFDTQGGAGIGVSAGTNGLGISLSTNQGFGYSIPGVSSTLENGSAGNISTETNSTSLNFIVFNYSEQKMRYWSDETETTNIFGALNSVSTNASRISDGVAYDGYSVLTPPSAFSETAPRPEKQQGGAFPNFDSYQVTAQGLGGVMRPYQYRGQVLQQNIIERTSSTVTAKTVDYFSTFSNTVPSFRFENDFSNSYIQNYSDYANVGYDLTVAQPPFGDPIADSPTWYNGYLTGELAGSRHISYFLTNPNGTIVNVDANRKFITPVAKGLVRQAHTPKSQSASHIAGFSITNESGVTYHYNLPAYSYGEEVYQERISQAQGLMFNRQTKEEGYAYTWHLTAITGPDYVDRGIAGVIDEADYGYWISFEYGKWSDQYVWRNPGEDYNRTEDRAFRTVAMGKKEVYYLNAIKTRTHTAFFEKNVRNDAKGASPEVFNKVMSPQNQVATNYQYGGVYNQNSSQSLRLDHIYLLNNADASAVLTNSGGAGSFVPTSRSIPCSTCELHGNTLDINDVNAVGRSALEAKAIRVIDFNYDYSLAKGVVNSYGINSPALKDGKLTLSSVNYRGAGGASYIPPVEFSYNLDALDIKKGSGNVTTAGITGANVNFALGDLVETDETNPIYCGVVTGITTSGGTYSYNVTGSNVSTNLGVKNLRTTKNPPYHRDKHDVWGLYKADYIASTTSNDNIIRATSPISNKSTDVWSLRKVKTSLGSEIKMAYEGNEYSTSGLTSNHSIIIYGATHVSANDWYLDIFSSAGITSLSNLFKVNDELDFFLLKKYMTGSTANYITVASYQAGRPRVTSISNNRIYFTATSGFTDEMLYGTGGGTWEVLTGNLSPYAYNKYYGGGVRVKSLTIDNLLGTKSITEYSYTNNQGLSSGSAIYEPIGMEEDHGATYLGSTSQDLKYYRYFLNGDLERMLPISRELPAPFVMYEYVTISSRVENNTTDVYIAPRKTVYQYEVFKNGKVVLQEATPNRGSSDASYDYATRNIVLKKFTNSLGALKSVSAYDSKNSLLTRTIFHYLHDGLDQMAGDFFARYEERLVGFRKQGLIKERYAEVKSVKNGTKSKIMATMTGRESYPLIKTGTSSYDYVNNTHTSDIVKSYDFYNGQITEQISSDSYGNRFLVKNVPAYTKYPEMGLKMGSNSTKKNMLTQIAASYTYKVDANNAVQSVVAATANQWGRDVFVKDPNGQTIQQNTAALGNVWRLLSTYGWLPNNTSADGATAIGQFSDFDFSNPSSSNINWQKLTGITLYDVYSKVLEQTDINSIYGAERYGYKNSKVVIKGSPAKYRDLAFSGAEDETISASESTQVLKGDGVVTTAAAHTGTSSLQVANRMSGFTYTVPMNDLTQGGSYIASVWVKPTSGTAHDVKFYYQIDGVTKFTSVSSSTSSLKSGEWTLINLNIHSTNLAAGTTLKISCRNDHTSAVYLDDFRFQPFLSTTQAYVYDKQSGDLTYVLDNNNLFTRYEYDGMGRLKAVYIEQFGRAPFKVKEYQQHYRSIN
jgi:hypothetical protein